MDKFGKVLERIYLRWSLSHGVYYSKMRAESDEVSEVGTLCSIKLSSSIAKRDSLVKETYLMKQFIYRRHWTQQWIYVGRFAPDFEEGSKH